MLIGKFDYGYRSFLWDIHFCYYVQFAVCHMFPAAIDTDESFSFIEYHSPTMLAFHSVFGYILACLKAIQKIACCSNGCRYRNNSPWYLTAKLLAISASLLWYSLTFNLLDYAIPFIPPCCINRLILGRYVNEGNGLFVFPPYLISFAQLSVVFPIVAKQCPEVRKRAGITIPTCKYHCFFCALFTAMVFATE